MAYLPIRRIDYVSLRHQTEQELKDKLIPLLEDIRDNLQFELASSIYVCARVFCIEDRTMWYVYDREIAKIYNLENNIIKMESNKKVHKIDYSYSEYYVPSNSLEYVINVDNLKPNMYIDVVLGDE